MSAIAEPKTEAPIEITLPKELRFLLELHRFKVLYGGRGGGKCLAFGTNIIMADGSTKAIEHVRIGEKVMGPDSKPRTVLGAHKGYGNLFTVSQKSGIDYVVSDHHLLAVKKSLSARNDKRIQSNGNARSPRGRYPNYDDVGAIDIKIFATQSKRFRAHFRGYKAGLLKFKAKRTPIDPYFLGVWLGDGTSRELRITSADKEVIDYCKIFARKNGGAASINTKPGTSALGIGICVKRGRTNLIWEKFKALDLPNNKHIPANYLTNSEAVRLQLLAGLIDTDGYLHNGTYEIVQVNQHLARQIKYLADTLGFKTRLRRKQTVCSNNGVRGEAWRLSICGDINRVPCKIARKRVAKSDLSKNKDWLLSALDIKPCGKGNWAGVALSGDQLFMLEDGTVVHNSWAIADALLALGASEQGGLRILCAREVQDSLKSSVHQLLVDRIAKFDLGFFYKITDKEIRGRNGTVFTFTGLGKHTVDSIKSFEGVDVVWVEEAQTVAKRSWDILIPTIRKLNSEIWVSFNPDLVTDEVWIRFIVHPTQHAAPFDCVSRKMNWSDNKHFPEVMEKDRLTCQIVAPLDYDNIWEGMCRTTIAGAIYATEINLMREQQRIRPTPYDPRFQVHTIWDLGWNDMMAIVMVQKISPSVLNIINYREVNFLRYDELVEELKTLKYRWGWDWLPHDAAHANPQTGIGAAKALRKLGRRVRPPMQKTGPEQRIKAARMMFPRIYIDDADRSSSAERGHLGCARLIDCLSHYRRMVPLTTGEPGAPRHDEYSHGADGFGALAEIVDRIMDDEFEEKLPVIEGFQNFDPGMGLLG